MLQQIRDKITGWFAAVFLGAIAVVFIFWGIQFESSINVAAAKVNGEKVSVEEVRRAWQERQRELQQQLRDELPAELVATEQQKLLDNYIRRTLLLQRADEFGYRVSDRELAQALAAIPALQVDGKFSRDRYAALLRSQGRTEAGFEAEFRKDLQLRQLQNAIAVSGFALPHELMRRFELQDETRVVQVALVPAAAYADGVTVSDEQIAADYAAHKADYQTTETVNLQYLRLDLADVAAGVEVTEDGLRQYYDEVAPERYATPERRQARHILIESGSDDAAALAEAEKLAAEARAGADFAALAREHSDDPGSKEQGGDLGWATRESFVAPFADALFGMQVGEIAGPVKTQFGYHVIKLEAVEPAAQRSFEDVRAELETDYRRHQAESLFYERSQALADEAFAALSELDTVAQKLGLELRSVQGFTRQGGGPFGDDRKVIDAVFSDEVLQDRQNSPAINIGDEGVVVLRVTDHQPSTQRPLEDVRPEIEAKLRAAAANEAAAAAAREAAARVAAGSSLAEVAKELGVQPGQVITLSRSAPMLPPDLTKAVFTAAAPAAGAVTPGSAALPDGAAVFVVNSVRRGSIPSAEPARLAQAEQQVAGQATVAEFAGYVGELERNAKITRNPSVFDQQQPQ